MQERAIKNGLVDANEGPLVLPFTRPGTRLGQNQCSLESPAAHLKVAAEVPELLVGYGLYGGGVDGARAVLGSQRQRVLCYSRLACTRVRSHKDTVPLHPPEFQHAMMSALLAI